MSTDENKSPDVVLFHCKWGCGSYKTFNLLMKHMSIEEYSGNKHTHCHYCGRPFHSKDARNIHIQQKHPREQDLECPGCKQKFARAGNLVRHLEGDECTVITSEEVETRREEKIAIAQKLEDLAKADPAQQSDNKSFGTYLGGKYTADPNNAFVAHPNFFTSSKYPARGGAKAETQPDTGDPKESTAEAAVLDEWLAPTEEELAQGPDWSMAAMGEPLLPQALEIRDRYKQHDPNSPAFNVKDYFNPTTSMYKCPYSWCGKSFSIDDRLVLHLKGLVHTAGHRGLQCPRCSRYFKNIVSLAAHSEAQSTRCNLRNTLHFRTFMDQLTGGMIDVAEDKHEDETVKYLVSTEAVVRYGPAERTQGLLEESQKQNKEQEQGSAWEQEGERVQEWKQTLEGKQMQDLKQGQEPKEKEEHGGDFDVDCDDDQDDYDDYQGSEPSAPSNHGGVTTAALEMALGML